MDRKIFAVLLAGLVWASLGQADDASLENKLSEAQTLYSQRADLSKLDAAIALLEVVEKDASDSDLKYSAMILHSKCLYTKGTHAGSDSAKQDIHLAGKEKAEQAIEENPDYADAYYESAAHLGRWAEAKGVIASLSKKKEIMKTLDTIFELDTSKGELGETYEWYGADRVLGRLYFKLPGFAGGSQQKSLRHLSKAYAKAPTNALNVIYYAETLYNGSSAEKEQAKKILDTMLANDPKTFNPDRIPETVEEFVTARKLRSEMR